MRFACYLVLATLVGACSTGGLLLASSRDGGTTCDPLDEVDAGCDAEDASGDGS